jgi:hypothetical protein
MYHSLGRAFLYTAHKLVIAFNDYGTLKQGSGTGFFVNASDKTLWLVTSRHLLDPGYSDSAKRHWTISTIRLSGFLPPDFARYECDLIVDEMRMATSSLEDVVAARVVTTVNGNWSGQATIAIQHVPSEMIASSSDFEALQLADPLLFPGYPDWHDQSDGRPIMRRGLLSSDPIFNYLGPDMTVGGRILAYEAFSFGGSSGSPVFLPEFGIKINGDPKMGNYRPAKLIGVNAGHMRTRDGTRHHSGISYLFRSTIIEELLAV